MAILNNSVNSEKNYIIVQDLPMIGEESKIYLLPNPNGSENNKYIEYGFVNGRWEMIGYSDVTNNINIDMSGYLTVKQAEKDYQPKGNYLTDKDSETLVTKQLLKNELVKKQNKGETVTLTANEKLIGEDKDGNPHSIALINKKGNVIVGDSKSHLNLVSSDKVTINNEDVIATENFVDRKINSIDIPTDDDFATKMEYRKVIKSIEELNDKLPTKVSELRNDTGYITIEDVPEPYDDKEVKTSIKNLSKELKILEEKGGYDDTAVKTDIKNNRSEINRIIDRLEILENEGGYDDSEIRQLIRKVKEQLEYKQDKGDYATVEFVRTGLNTKAEKTLLDTVIQSLFEDEDFVKTTTFENRLSQLDFVSKEQLSNELSKKADKEAFDNVKNLLDVIISALYEEKEFVSKIELEERLKEIVGLDIKDLVTKDEVPTKLSELENDTNFITEQYDDTEIDNRIKELEKIDHETFVTKEWVEDKNYLTEHQDLSDYVNKTYLENAIKNKADKSELDDVVKYQKFTYNNEERKTIQLDNHDTISGKDNTGTGHNLVMLSKWNVADFGAAGVHLNLNTLDNVTINDSDVVLTDKSADEKYQPKGEYLTEHQSLDEYAKLTDIVEYDDTELKKRIETLEKIDNSIYAKKTDVETSLDTKQDKGDYLEYVDDNGRKVITLNNNDIIGAVANTEQEGRFEPSQSWNALIALNKWNVVDLGSPYTKLNLNTPKGIRPTVQEKGQSGADAHEIAYLNDLKNLNYATKNEIDNLKQFIKSVLNNNIDTVTTSDNKTKTEGDLIVTGKFVGNSERTTYTVNDGNINCYDLDITNSSLALIATKGDIIISELNTSGDCFVPNKLRSLSIDGGKSITIKDCEMNEVCYNGIQINMDKALSDNITISNINMDGVQNNGIIIFGTKDDVIIDIKDVNITSAKNAFRFSNRSNAKNIVVNLENINIDSVREKLFLFEDMKKAEGKYTTDLFVNLTFNIKNVKVNGNLLTSETPYKSIMQMVVGRPSQSEDIQVELSEEVLPKFNFV